MMTESGDQKIGWQDDSCTGVSSSEGNLSGKDKLVAGAGFEPTTFGL